MEKKKTKLIDKVAKYVQVKHIKHIVSVLVLVAVFGLLVIYFAGYWQEHHQCMFTTVGVMGSGFFLTLYLIQNKMLYIRNAKGKKGPVHHEELRYSDLEITTEDNVKLRGWHITKEGADKLFVCFHGNKGIIGYKSHFLSMLSKNTNSDIVMFAYRGYSFSEGFPTQKGLEYDAEAIIKEAVRVSEEKNIPLFVFGRSLGGATAICAAGSTHAKDKIKGLVLENAFASTTKVILDLLPILWIVYPIVWLVNTNPWPSVSRIHKVKGPVMFIKGMKDTLINPENSDLLRQQCEENNIKTHVYEIEEGKHSNSWTINEEEYYSKFNNFIKNYCMHSHSKEYEKEKEHEKNKQE